MIKYLILIIYEKSNFDKVSSCFKLFHQTDHFASFSILFIEHVFSLLLYEAVASINFCVGDFCVFHDFNFASKFCKLEMFWVLYTMREDKVVQINFKKL